MQILLLVSLLGIATSGLVYQLSAAALATSLLGDSVLQFSTIIGTYLFAMGAGSYASGRLRRQLVVAFIQAQFAVGFLGGISVILLWITYGYGSGFRPLLYLFVFLIGALVGLELPLLLRILRDRMELRELVARVLGLDYLGALLGSLLFPLFLAPQLGLVKTAIAFGLMNIGLALVLCLRLDQEGRWPALRLEGSALFLVLLLVLGASDRITEKVEQAVFPDPVLLARTTSYQRIVLTRRGDDIRLFLNNNLQFSSRDEYRYHEALVVPALRSVKEPRKVVVMGGGDGLAVSLLLKDPRVEEILLVELDPVMTELFSRHPLLRELNSEALVSPRVRILHQDAFVWLDTTSENFDLAIVDFPDPSNYSIGKLYTELFYRRLRSHLNPGGAVAVQCSSPYFARRTYWCIVKTMQEAGFGVRPYHAMVPSFGEWGFCLAGPDLPGELLPAPVPTRFLDEATLRGMFVFPRDMAPLEVESNRIFDQQLVRYFQADWSRL